ncbi:hypothetical protein PPERSA_01084 [Pseudocohnilembus persalinus]|uniref:Uncharacterized protein n=1 Tax=Pseudocohnilembus persalinus TaxID=266149 RepID=A0A0V0QV26_PSEPJ|nr:hypothetical protein PPERSA_01084 [Pseudocohnilembus persalinus]|eukprot:KRX06006.1 hypothetical protein PPERSA_01084 [Pseudocohnilembus persalinus]
MGACFSLFNDPEKMSMTIKGMYVHGYSKINNFIGEIRKIVLLQDKMLTFKTIISLYFVMKVLSLFGDYFGYCIMVTAFMWFDKIVLALENLYQQTAGKAAGLFKQIPAYKVQKNE